MKKNMNEKKDELTLSAGLSKCNYPDCENCKNNFEIPMCVLEEANLEAEKAILIEPRDEYVITKNDEEDEI